MNKISFLGTAAGMPIQSTCSAILIEDNTNNILLDTGGGHDIIGRFHDIKKDPAEVQNVFISHYDSDHILGIVPLVRKWKGVSLQNKINIFCSVEVKDAVESLFLHSARSHYESAKESMNFIIINDRMEYGLNGWKFTFFDIQSNKSPQFGCKITLSDGKTIAFPGDEPMQDHYLDIIKESDILIHEAFCLDSEKDTFKPHEKNHGTVKEAAQNATRANVGKLFFYHMEDHTLDTRKERYAEEAKKYFNGEVVVPIDGNIFEI